MRKLIFFVFLYFLFSLFSLGAGTADQAKNLYDPIINSIALKYGVDRQLVHSVIKAESNYNRFAVSPKGAMGLMQLMPETALEYGVADVFDPAQNIEGGVKYLKDLLSIFNGNRKLVLAAYNAGQEAVRRYGHKIPPYSETREYVRRVLEIYNNGNSVPKTIIYSFYDSEGKLVITNDYNLYLMKRGEKEN